MLDKFQLFTDDVNAHQFKEIVKHEVFANLYVMRIGIIEEIIDSMNVRCSLTNRRMVGQNPDGTMRTEDYSPVFAKVIHLGYGEAKDSRPPAVKQPCLLFFNDREIESFFTNYQLNDLQGDRMHDLNDCFCLPIWFPQEISGYTMQTNSEMNLSANIGANITSPNATVKGNLNISTGASGVVAAGTAMITFSNGICTKIE